LSRTAPAAPTRHRIAPAVWTLAPWAALVGFTALLVRPRTPRPARTRGGRAVTEPKPRPGLSRATVAEPEVFEAQEPGRGRLAGGPWEVPGLGWRDIAWRTWQEVNADRLTVVAGSVTYYTLLAVFPALGVFVSLYGLIADVTAVREQLVQLAGILPPEAVSLIGEQMLRLATGKAAGLSVAFVVSLLLSLWSANAGMKSLFDGLNIAYDETEKRNYLARTALTYGFTAALIVFMTAVSAVLVAAPIALERLGLRTDLLLAARWPLVFVLAAAAFTVAYRFGPSRQPARWRWLVPGGVAAAVFWMAGSAGFSWYLNNVASLDATYGSLGAVIGFLLWVWFSVMVVLIGAELNSEIEHQTALDSTTGPPMPMGERGAAMADTVGRRFIGFREGAGLVRQRLAALRGRRRMSDR
jgi:membrane protein